MNSGGSAWIGANVVALTGPRSSMGSPVTLMIRPRVPWPTGILMGAPVSSASAPRTRPSVPVYIVSRTSGCAPSACGNWILTVHGNAADDVLTQVLLQTSLVGVLRRSGAELGSDWAAYRDLEHQLVVTVLGGQGIENRGELLALKLDWIPASAMMDSMSVLSRPRVDGGQKSFSHTVDDGTDDLVDLAALGDISAGEASRQRRSEVLLDGLEGAKRRPAEGGGPQRPVDAAANPSRQRLYGANGIGNRLQAYLLSILQDVGGQGRWEWRGGWGERKLVWETVEVQLHCERDSPKRAQAIAHRSSDHGLPNAGVPNNNQGTLTRPRPDPARRCVAINFATSDEHLIQLHH